jgi:hypothetical protein
MIAKDTYITQRCTIPTQRKTRTRKFGWDIVQLYETWMRLLVSDQYESYWSIGILMNSYLISDITNGWWHFPIWWILKWTPWFRSKNKLNGDNTPFVIYGESENARLFQDDVQSDRFRILNYLLHTQITVNNDPKHQDIENRTQNSPFTKDITWFDPNNASIIYTKTLRWRTTRGIVQRCRLFYSDLCNMQMER